MLKRFCFACGALMMTVFFSACQMLMLEDYDRILRLNTPVEMSDMSAAQLIEQMNKVTDPDRVWRDCKSYIMRQSTRQEQLSGKTRTQNYFTQEIKFRQKEQMRQTYFRNGEPFSTMLYRDGKVWLITANGTAHEITKKRESDLTKSFLGFSNPKADVLTEFHSVEVAVVYEDGKRLYRMVCRHENPRLAPYVKYISADTFLTVRIETVNYAADGQQYLFSSEPTEYRWINGVQITTKIHATTGNFSEEYTVEEFLINPVIPDSDFELPKGAAIDYTKTR